MKEKDLEALQERYRETEAPPWLATRIRARLNERSADRAWWKPALALVTAGAAALLILPLALQQQPNYKPSLTTPPSLSGVKPSMTSLSLTRIKSVRTPAPPPRPRVNPNNRPQTHFEIDYRHDRDDRMEETTHV